MIQYRKSTVNDIPFLISCVLAAESFVGSNEATTNTYCQIFNISRPEAEQLLQEMFEQEEEGSEFDPNAYLIASIDNQDVAACCSWIESDLFPSSTIKAQMISYLLGPEKWAEAQQNLKILAQANISRQVGTLQLESFYTAIQARGQGIASNLIRLHLENHPNVSAEIQLVIGNESAFKAYQHAGFELSVSSTQSEELIKLIGGRGKIKMALNRHV